MNSTINIKRPLPARLTYRQQSEPVVLRLPQADPNLSLHLYGEGLVFDPPVLTFAKSSEASFRVTGVSLGPKTMLMCRSGANALRYSGLPLSKHCHCGASVHAQYVPGRLQKSPWTQEAVYVQRGRPGDKA